jgi:hypothetical protein
MNDLLKKIESEIEVCSFDLLSPHHKREALYFVKTPNDLAQVGMLAADNKAHLIKGLMEAGELYRPKNPEIDLWEKDLTIKFKFIIVSPFVFIQKI